jgi:uncharacterized protein (DUF488 family)
MQTSYFFKNGSDKNAVSIAGKPPAWYSGKQYKKLAPKYWFLKKYKDDGDKDFYIEQFKKEILEPLDPKKVYEELGENSILLCWEKPGDFCHRHLVAEWLSSNLNIPKIEEIKDE